MPKREISLFGEVTADSAEWFKSQVDAASEADEIVVRIDSPGGHVLQGFSIFEAIRKHTGRTVAIIESAALSIASYIAMAFDEIEIAPNGYVMIHDPSVATSGGADKLEGDAKLLRKLKASMVEAYSNRTGIEAGKIREMLKAETFLDAKDCMAEGFADRISGDKTASRITASGTLPPRVVASLFGAPDSSLPPTKKVTQVTDSEPKAASVKEIRAAFGGLGDSFILKCVEESRPMASVTELAAETLQVENESLKAQLQKFELAAEAAAISEAEAAEATAKAEAEAKAKADADAKAKAEAEAKAKAGEAIPKGTGEGDSKPAVALWRSAIKGFTDNGIPHARAVVQANRENPGLRERMLAEVNASKAK